MESLRNNYPAPRRVATAPITTSPVPAPRSASVGGLVETLYNHPNVKIVAFSAASRGRARSPGRGPADEPGTLSPYSQLERTIAIGPFRIYRTGSVAFLNCGSALQPMLPKSQCWALEEDSSKFVLQIRRPNYWRIEIPVTNPTEQELAAAFKVVLAQILQFEKTECPFKRSFTVALPEKPKTPVKKRPWTPPVKGALPVLSLPTHEISPTQPKALTPKTQRRASASLSVRGRTELRRFSVIGTEFQSSSESRGTSTETSRSGDPPREQRLVSESAIEEEKTQTSASATETATETITNAEKSRRFFAEKIKAEDASNPQSEKSRIESGPEATASGGSLTEPKETGMAPVELQVQKRSAGGSQAEEPLNLDNEKDKAAQLQELDEQMETTRPTTAIAIAALDPLLFKEGTSSPQMQNKVKEASHEAEEEVPISPVDKDGAEKRASKLMIPGHSRSSSSPTAEPQIKEQLVTVRATPRSPSSFEVGTPTPTNIYDVIRNYEQKLAAAPSSTAPIEEVKVVEVQPQAETGNASDTGSGSGRESSSGTDGEVLEGNGVGVGRRKKLRSFRKGRALVPPQLTLVTSPPSKSAMRQTPILEEQDDAKEPVSPTDSSDSFHSVKSWHSPVTPIPRSPASEVSPTRFPYPHDNILIPKKPWHYRDISDMTVTPETRRTWDATSCLTDDSSQESAATAPDIPSEVAGQPDKVALSEDEAVTTAVTRRPYMRHRATTSSISVGRTALATLPSAANLFASTTTATRRQPFLRSRLDIVRRIPMAIVSKTCEVLLGPPAHLITLMLQVAAKIAAGEWRGMMFGFGEGGETIPVQWDYSDDEYSSWGEDDDYYLSQVESSRANSVVGDSDYDDRVADDNADGMGRGWEVD
ncbi:hypothetical protein CGMCC3_g15786 [Colletotrichum fructicola]|uniref:Inheritance of peroxisomes protein 1 n=1 Tax=Colletotrichum fructicola (strain Nara gc5) TaxID=1213859 RepID=L2FBL1_COLFN|nr:uncharacterized protein CGMCC3_g15786 [Colletotrichum fructicola]KAF4477450.1 hypothetical protein CGGC5_v013888 [Colletotrichum fructicola Nara gc5]KAI8274747.1 hypothetical protein K4K60_009307 [Colletotrichum sp. SAR11_57]KAE9568127.1 hypothetical protein CGMCC3_g15786 [Colletotrichum fructicola]KAF4411780.1 hypothetical protein CFRS1_v001645 [Colletotrichum fructicola]KAF4884195.1 hypothetical protein CGCFRS4_v012928 [Colletotrichum fructicola]